MHRCGSPLSPDLAPIVSYAWFGIRTILFAGHETTATALSWTLLELSRNQAIQNRLRSEIRAMEKTIVARGDQDFMPADVEGMPYLNAVLKVCVSSHALTLPCWIVKRTGSPEIPSCFLPQRQVRRHGRRYPTFQTHHYDYRSSFE